MDDNILMSIKRVLGIAPDYDAFDYEIMAYANSVFQILYQIGVGDEPFILDGTSTWKDFYDDKSVIAMCRIYVPLKVKILFDPSSSSSTVMDSTKEHLDQMEIRIRYAVDRFESTEDTQEKEEPEDIEYDDLVLARRNSF